MRGIEKFIAHHPILNNHDNAELYAGRNMEKIETQNKQRAFTGKALIAGLIGILLIAGASKITPTLASQALLQHQLGIGIYFYIFMICLLWNPFWSMVFPKLAFNVKELAVVMVMSLTAGGFAWIGWLKQIYTQTIILPNYYSITPSWKNYRILDFIDPNTLPDTSKDERVISRFMEGTPKGEWVNFFKEIPWESWTHMFYWGILVIVISLMSLAILMIVHRQWIRNEKLSYPLATVAESLFKKSDPKNYFSDLFKNNLFWLAFAFVVFIHLFNYLSAAFPAAEIGKIPLVYSLTGLETIIPSISTTGAAVTSVRIMFLIIGIAYFLAPALSLSVGLNAFVYLIFAAQVVEITGKAPTDSAMGAFRAGAYLAFFIMLIILGRRYYGSVMLKALFLGKTNDDDRGAVIGARLFMITALGTMFLFTAWGGMELPMAILMTFVVIIVYLVFTRIICEAGIPMMATPFMPVSLFAKMFGGAAMGPYNLMSTGSTSGVLFGDMKQLLMPYIATGMKLGEDANIKMRRMAAVVSVSIILAFVFAFSVHIWQYYSLGIKDAPSKTTTWGYGINEAVSEIGRLHINGLLEPYGISSDTHSSESETAKVLAGPSFFERFGNFSPDSEVWVYFIFGLIAVFIVGFLRTRFLWWPFHAVIFCIWKTEPANIIWASFLFGWFFRMLIVRFGGEQNYIKLKPVFLGLIFGDIFAAGMIILYGLIYYICTSKATTIIYQV